MSVDPSVALTWPRIVKLRYPIDFGSDRIMSLEFQRGKLGHLKGIKLSGANEIPADDLMTIASRMCGQPRKVIEMLDVDDAGEVTDIALDFYAKCLTAGQTG